MAAQRLFIIHGWSYSTEKWQPTLELLRQAGIQPVMLRVPGLTESSKIAWDIASYTAWLDDQLTGVSQPIILGHSNGGRIALNYCLFRPNKIAKLILVCSAGVVDRSKTHRAKKTVFKLAAKLFRPLRSWPLACRLVRRLAASSDYDKAQPHMKLTLINLLKSDKHLRLDQITTPTAIIWGSQDSVTPIRQAQELKQRLQQVVDYQVINGAGHIPYASHPQQLADIIVKLVKSS